MGRVKKLVAGSAIVAGAAGVGILVAPLFESEYSTALDQESDRQLVEQTVSDTGKFWATQGLVEGNSVQANIVEGEDVAGCGGMEVDSESLSTVYCSGTLNMSVALINQARSIGGRDFAEPIIRATVRDAMGAFVLGEDAALNDAVTNLVPETDDPAFYRLKVVACLAGKATFNAGAINAEIDPSYDTQYAFTMYQNTGDSREEGGPLAQAYSQGFQAQNADRNGCINV